MPYTYQSDSIAAPLVKLLDATDGTITQDELRLLLTAHHGLSPKQEALAEAIFQVVGCP